MYAQWSKRLPGGISHWKNGAAGERLLLPTCHGPHLSWAFGDVGSAELGVGTILRILHMFWL